MKHTLIYRATMLALIASTAMACSNEMTDAEGTGNGNNNEGELITVTATQQAGDPNGQQQADQPQTRLDYNFATDNGSVAVTWKKDDKFYVNNDASWVNDKKLSDEASKFKPFTLQGEGGSKTGNFSGTMPDGTTDKAQLYALYGKAEQMKTSEKTIILDYDGQQQTANDDKAHLADYDFMTAYVTYQAGQQTAFNFTHQGAMMKFTITMPEAGMTVKELRLAATDLSVDGNALKPFCTTSMWKTADNTLESSNTSSNTSSNVYLKLGGDKGLVISGTTLTAYMMVAPTTLTATGNPIAGKKMMLLVTASDDKIYSALLTGAEIKKAHYYTVTATLSSSSIFEGGNGTKDKPYEINDAGHLRNMAILVNSNIMNANYEYFSSAYFKLTDDIDLDNEEWTPIGTTNSTFYGNLTGAKEDGGNYEIKDLSIKGNYSSGQLRLGLFGQLNGVVSNVTVSGEISPTIVKGNEVYAGGIAGYNSGKTPATNCVSNCKINITNSPSKVYAGGIIGYIAAPTVTLTNCSNTGAITLSTSNQSQLRAGGIIGYFNVYLKDYPFTLTLNGYSNAGTPAAVIGYYDFTTNSQSKIEIKQTQDSSNPIVITSGSGSYPAITNGDAGSYPDGEGMY